MATIVRGDADKQVQALKSALEAYETAHNDTEASLYRSNSAAIRLRVIDRRFEGMNQSRRHADVWEFLAAHVSEDALSDISQLITLAPSEIGRSLANLDFEDPAASQL